MSDTHLLMPRLREFDWKWREVCCCRPLEPTFSFPTMPVVVFGFDRPNSVEYIKRSGLPELGLTESEVEQLAIKNLCKRSATWQRTTLNPQDSIIDVLFIDEDFFNAERILNDKCMMKAQELLNAPLLAVGIPCQGMLLVTNGAQDPTALSTFIQLVYVQYKQSTNPGITPTVLAMNNGQVIGRLGFENDTDLPDVPTPMDNVKVTHLMGRPPGEVGFAIILSVIGSDPEETASVVWSHLVTAINTIQSKEDFCGIFRVMLSPEKMPDTNDQQRVIEMVQRRFTGLMNDHQLTTIGGLPLTLQITVLQ